MSMDLGTYEPDLPGDDWARVRQFVLDAVTELSSRLTYPDASIMTAVARHVDWCVNVAGIPMTRASIFRRDVIAAAVAAMDTSKSATMGRRRSLLLRAGEVFGAIENPPKLTPLAAASPSAPYTAEEVYGVIRWAEAQNEPTQRSARALIALGLGAGLPTRDLTAVRASDICTDGRALILADRSVPILSEWSDELAALSATAAERHLPLFRPGIARHRNIVTTFVSRSNAATLQPSTQRMRATWLVEHLATGTPMQDLLAAAGLRSMDALVRYEVFLPPPSQAVLEGTTR